MTFTARCGQRQRWQNWNKMNDNELVDNKELIDDIRLGLIIIMRAVIRRYGLAWSDFLPPEDILIIHQVADDANTTLPFAEIPE